MTHRAFLLTAVLLLGCSDAEDTTDAGPDPASDAGPTDAGLADAGPADAGPPDAGVTCTEVDGEVVTLTTADDVALEADLHVPADPSGAAVALFHMIPPFNDRTNYPADFIDALTGRGIVVLNVDRRGAGGSEGDPVEAYTGPNGKLDVAAAVGFLLDHACAPEPSRIGLVGASNGTTSVLDYAVFAADDADAAEPAALVFLTGGGYTENQNAIADHRDVLDPLAIQLVYSTAESAWSAGFEADAPATWQFDEYADGDHGTVMFTAAPSSIGDVAAFLEAAL